jgi:hypothetical protein
MRGALNHRVPVPAAFKQVRHALSDWGPDAAACSYDNKPALRPLGTAPPMGSEPLADQLLALGPQRLGVRRVECIGRTPPRMPSRLAISATWQSSQ